MSPVYIQFPVSIGAQNSFLKGAEPVLLEKLGVGALTIHPNYSEYLSLNSLRRFSPILKMAVTSAKACLQSFNREIDGVLVGTALGCLVDSQNFLGVIANSNDGSLSPTNFIYSTHNTIAGQISIELKNFGFNATYSQLSRTTEAMLIESCCLLAMGYHNLLVGCADETIEFMNLLKPELFNTELPLTSGATFFVLSDSIVPSGIHIKDISIADVNGNEMDCVNGFLLKNGLEINELKSVLGNNRNYEGLDHFVDYSIYTGYYFTNTAFALHMAHDLLLNSSQGCILIINEMIPGKLGLILLANYAA